MSVVGTDTPGIVWGSSPDTQVDVAPQQQWRYLRITGAVAIGAQFVVTLALSAFLFHRFHLIEDFGIFNQAWTQIGQGHLDPFNSIYGFPFYKSHFELIMWPLALMHLVYPQPVSLLWFQDLTAAGAEFVAFVWIIEHLEKHRVATRVALPIGGAALVAILVNPLLWGTVVFDFHFESTAALFAVLAARAFYRERFVWAWVWVGATLLCGDLPALYVVGIGVSALLAGRATRYHGLALVAVGGAWLGLINVIGANLGSALSDYAYLAGRTELPASGGMGLVVIGVLTHPGRVLHELRIRLHDIWVVVEPAGGIGIASAWGCGVPMVVLVTSALNSSPNYIGSPFQNFALFPFMLFGTVTVLVWLAARLHGRWVLPAILGTVLFLLALVSGITTSTTIVRTAIDTGASAAQAAELRTVLQRTPGDAEVAASLRVVGRFSGRQFAYLLVPSTEAIPVNSPDVVVVVALTSGIDSATPAEVAATTAALRGRFDVKVLSSSNGVYAFRLSVPKGVSQIDLTGTGH
jgi:hypothetical protein